MKFKRFFMDSRDTARSAVFWNALSAASGSFQTMILLLVITRTGKMFDANIFVTAYAAGNLLVNLGKFGTRQVQATDIREKYSYYDYLTARRMSVVWMMLAVAGYLSVGVLKNEYSKKKAFIMLMACLLKSIEAYEDVYHGRMQQQGRLDTAGKIFAVRMFVYIAGFSACYVLTRDLMFACAVNVMASFVLFIVCNHAVLGAFVPKKQQAKTAWKAVLLESFPVGVCQCLYMYTSNAPKLIVDTVLDEYTQTCFNIIFMAVFVVSLLGGFLTTPLVGKIGEKWQRRDAPAFFSLVLRVAFFIMLADASLAVLGNLVGCTMLGWIYQVDLSAYRMLLTIFLIAGGAAALQNLFQIAVTAIGYQKYMAYGYGFSAGVMFFFGKKIVRSYGLYGLAVFFLMLLALLAGYCAWLVALGLKNAG